MAVISCDDGNRFILDNFLTPSYHIHLYSNNLTLSSSTVLGDFVECTFSGSQSKTLSFWTDAAIINGQAQTFSTNTYWVCNSTPGTPENIYGYYVTNTDDDKLYWCEEDPNGPKVISVAGDFYQIVPTFCLASEF